MSDSRTVGTGFVIVSLALVTACGGGSRATDPQGVVAAFYDAFKHHDAVAVCGVVTPAVAREMERPTHQVGKPCVPALKHVFELVRTSAFPNFFDDVPSIGAVHVVADRATVTVRGQMQTNTVRLRRIDGEWKISGDSGFH